VQKLPWYREMGKMGRGKENRYRLGPVLLLLILAVTVGLLAFVRTSFFCISDITVQGNSFVDEKEIVEYAGINPGMNIFRIDLKNTVKWLEGHPYILRADVERQLPNGIKITVKERDLIGYIPYMGSFLLVDNERRVISATAEVPIEGLPVFSGIKVENFQAKEILNIDNNQIFDKIIYISKCIGKNILQYAPIKVDVEDPEDIVIALADRFIIRIGDIEELDYKLSYSNTILEKLYSQEVGGEIDVTCGERAFFRPW
jgi:cell division protein FtsQ